MFNYLDDVVIYLRTLEDHARLVRVVLDRLQSAGFTLNFNKFTIAASEIKYLGHLLSSRGISILPGRVAAINSYPRPSNLRTLRRFLGMLGFYALFVPNFSKCAVVLHALKRKGS